MKHYFDVEIAKECGINAAIIYENIAFWVRHNEKNGKNNRDGKFWVYQTQKEMSEHFDYLSVKQVRTALEKLETAGYIIKGNYNKHGYDKTTWYSITDKANRAEEIEPAAEVEETPAEVPAEVAPIHAAETPRTASKRNGKGKYPYGRNQKPRRAEPTPVWLFGGGNKGATIQDLKTDSEKERLIKRMRELAADCGAVCTV